MFVGCVLKELVGKSKFTCKEVNMTFAGIYSKLAEQVSTKYHLE